MGWGQVCVQTRVLMRRGLTTDHLLSPELGFPAAQAHSVLGEKESVLDEVFCGLPSSFRTPRVLWVGFLKQLSIYNIKHNDRPRRQ